MFDKFWSDNRFLNLKILNNFNKFKISIFEFIVKIFIETTWYGKTRFTSYKLSYELRVTSYNLKA